MQTVTHIATQCLRLWSWSIKINKVKVTASLLTGTPHITGIVLCLCDTHIKANIIFDP
jgi:hypothetical protein